MLAQNWNTYGLDSSVIFLLDQFLEFSTSNRQLVALRLPHGLALFIYSYKLGLAQSIALARPGGPVPDPLIFLLILELALLYLPCIAIALGLDGPTNPIFRKLISCIFLTLSIARPELEHLRS